MADEYFGPALPPKSAEADETENLSEKLPSKRKHSKSNSSNSDSSSSSGLSSSNSGFHKRQCLSSEDPAHAKAVSAKHYGAPDRRSTVSNVSSFIGPVIPSGLLTNDKEDDINGHDWGPKPPGDDNNELQSTAAEIERRAERMRNKLLNKDNETQKDLKPERESWMMELPPERTGNFALVARTFSMAVPSAANMDRSSWTDTPSDRAKKEQDLISGKPPPVEKVSNESSRLAQRDSEYAQQIEDYNKSKKRDKSLMELHSEKKSKGHKKKKEKKEKHKERKKKKKDKDKGEEKEKKKDKKKKEKISERRPFDRDVDLKASRLDDAQRHAIIKRSQQLTGRFGHGSSTGKFL